MAVRCMQDPRTCSVVQNVFFPPKKKFGLKQCTLVTLTGTVGWTPTMQSYIHFVVHLTNMTTKKKVDLIKCEHFKG